MIRRQRIPSLMGVYSAGHCGLWGFFVAAMGNHPRGPGCSLVHGDSVVHVMIRDRVHSLDDVRGGSGSHEAIHSAVTTRSDARMCYGGLQGQVVRDSAIEVAVAWRLWGEGSGWCGVGLKADWGR